MGLTQQTCVPCKGGVAPLSREQAEEYMGQVPGWKLSGSGDRLTQRFKFDDFVKSLEFVNGVGALAEAEGHHPDISFGWGYAEIVFYTHKIHGLHINDFIMAAKTNGLI